MLVAGTTAWRHQNGLCCIPQGSQTSQRSLRGMRTSVPLPRVQPPPPSPCWSTYRQTHWYRFELKKDFKVWEEMIQWQLRLPSPYLLGLKPPPPTALPLPRNASLPLASYFLLQAPTGPPVSTGPGLSTGASHLLATPIGLWDGRCLGSALGCGSSAVDWQWIGLPCPIPPHISSLSFGKHITDDFLKSRSNNASLAILPS